MKILFLDIDGVVNCATTAQRHRGFIGIDPYMAILVDRIKQATGCVVVLSSTWRLDINSRKEVMEQCTSFIATTPRTFLMEEESPVGRLWSHRGDEIKAWIDDNREDIDQYAILDDDTAAGSLPELAPNYFRTYWEEGLTQEIADKVIAHLNK